MYYEGTLTFTSTGRGLNDSNLPHFWDNTTNDCIHSLAFTVTCTTTTTTTITHTYDPYQSFSLSKIFPFSIEPLNGVPGVSDPPFRLFEQLSGQTGAHISFVYAGGEGSRETRLGIGGGGTKDQDTCYR